MADAAAEGSGGARRWVVLGAGILAVVVCAVYANSLFGGFVFDDNATLVMDPRLFSEPWRIFAVPPGAPTSGRPVAAVSFALSYAISGNRPWGYHLLNVVVHVLAALTLFGVVRRTLCTGRPAERFGQAATPVAFACALLWAVHPLQTESVSYVSQRVESLMGLLFLLTLYCTARALASPRRRYWQLGAVVFCALGMGAKEVMAVAPLAVLLYDRTFGAGSFGGALRRRWKFYLCLAGTWSILAVLLIGGPRGATAGAGLEGVGVWEYARTQPGVILHYLWLTFWPGELCLVYDWPVADSIGEVLPGAVAVVLLLAGTLWGLWRRPAVGFLGAWFFLILAPTSSFVPIRDLAFEHRMYLPLAAVVVLVVLGVHGAARRPGREGYGWVALAVAALLAVGVPLSVRTVLRNGDYASEVSIWRATVAARPASYRPRNNLGQAMLRERGRCNDPIERGRLLDEAEKHLVRAVELDPEPAAALDNLGLVHITRGDLARATRGEAAVRHYERAVELHTRALAIEPENARIHVNLAEALTRRGRVETAMIHYRRAVALDGNYAAAHAALAGALHRGGKDDEAMRHYRRALEIDPYQRVARANLSVMLAKVGRLDEAIDLCSRGMALRPNDPAAHNNLASFYADRGEEDLALEHYRRAVELQRDSAKYRVNLGELLLKRGDADGAAKQIAKALSLSPSDLRPADRAVAEQLLARARLGRGRDDLSLRHFSESLLRNPTDRQAREGLAELVARGPVAGAAQEARRHQRAAELARRAGRLDVAATHYEVSLILDPKNGRAHANLAAVWSDAKRTDLALVCYQAAVDADPNLVDARYYLARLLTRAERTAEAVTHYRAAIRLRRDWPEAMEQLAWLLATDHDPEVRNGAEAVRLALRALKLKHPKRASVMDTLAAAYAENGQFELAVTAARAAEDFAIKDGANPAPVRRRLALYQAKKPYRRQNRRQEARPLRGTRR